MAAPVVSEKAIANLLKDFTRAALRAQPENLVLFGRSYFNGLDEGIYQNVSTSILAANATIQPTNAAPLQIQESSAEPPTEITTEALRRLQNQIYELSVDQIRQEADVEQVCKRVGLWNGLIRSFIKEHAGELTHSQLVLYACCIDNNGNLKNVLEALKTMFDVMGDESGEEFGSTMEVQQVVAAFADLALVHPHIDEILADRVNQFLLGQGFMDSDAEMTSKYDGRIMTTLESLLTAPCLQEWAQSHNVVVNVE